MAKRKPSTKNLSKRKKSDAESSRPIYAVPIAAVAAVVTGIVFYVRFFTPDTAAPNTAYTPDRQKAFLQWIVDNGGVFHPIQHREDRLNVTLEKFPEFGGWGLALNLNTTLRNEQCVSKNTEEKQCQMTAEQPIVRAYDPLFTIPSSLIITIPRVLETYASTTFYSRVDSILRQGLKGNGLSRQVDMMGLVEQDVILALYLMAEQCQHNHWGLFPEDSFYGPYLDVLPPGLIPRLDTFGDEEYKVLNDEVLEGMGRDSKRSLQEMFDGRNDGKERTTLREVLLDMIQIKLDSGSSSNFEKASCTSFESFHRFVALISSRAMVLRSVKRLVPLAEMMNYRALPEIYESRPSFEMFHTAGQDGSITVRSDRDVSGEADFIKEDGTVVVQLFEDYGPVDSSLFVEAHGFVPHENPHHCVVIPGSVIERVISPNGIKEADDLLIRHALQMLGLAPAKSNVDDTLLHDVCVRNDLTLVEDGDSIDVRPASDAISVVSVLCGGSDVLIKEQCIQAIKSNDAGTIATQCARHPMSTAVVRGALKGAAKSFVNKATEINRLETSLRDAEVNRFERMVVALRFRIEESRLLDRIVSSEHAGVNQ